ncbi:hypothetical protein [Streptomyces malaysiensis]|uniref:hypothetical protein n=1 Tax=Streptomyces malaysiensis TaxID=92644 RepID=UPI00142E9B83|nr:hypothetical protein [Streptomyces malaysiensis]
MTMSDVAAQMVSICVSAIGIVIFRIIARYLPEEPPPRSRDLPADTRISQPPSESDTHHG